MALQELWSYFRTKYSMKRKVVRLSWKMWVRRTPCSIQAACPTITSSGEVSAQTIWTNSKWMVIWTMSASKVSLTNELRSDVPPLLLAKWLFSSQTLKKRGKITKQLPQEVCRSLISDSRFRSTLRIWTYERVKSTNLCKKTGRNLADFRKKYIVN